MLRRVRRCQPTTLEALLYSTSCETCIIWLCIGGKSESRMTEWHMNNISNVRTRRVYFFCVLYRIADLSL